MASRVPAPTRWTYQRYLELDDDQRYEILDGELLMTPAPTTRHQRAVYALALLFGGFVFDRGLGEMFTAPTDVVLDDDELVQPDLFFIRAERVAEIVHERAIHGAPDLIVEIIAPYSIVRDRHQKLALYQRVGVLEYWIVDPANHAIEVLVLEEGEYQLASFAAESGAVVSRVLEGFQVEVAEVMPRWRR
jgi:Uma2 family endonuclease